MMRRIPHFATVLLMFLVACAVSYSQDRAPLLVTPAWLADHLADKNLVLLHVGAKGEFEKEHIPGAQSITYNADVSVPYQEGQLTLELLPVETLKANFEKRGISDGSRIVVYFGKDWVTPSTRVIFTLAYLGLGDRTSLLDGGMPAWVAAGHTTTAEVKTVEPGTLTPHPHPELVVDAAWVAAHLHKPGVTLIDARESEAYSGTDPKMNVRADNVPGYIPGAHNIPSENLVTDKFQLKEQPVLAELLRKAGATAGGQVVSYCWVGQRATLIWFTAKMLGYDAHLYDGSWQDWSERKDLPREIPPASAAPPEKLATGFHQDLAWSHDGSRIAYSWNGTGNYEIYVMKADGSDVRNMTNHPGSDRYATWSPDGKRIAFASNRAGNGDEIFVMGENRTDAVRLTHAGGTNTFPNWSSDGSRIVFMSHRDGRWQLFTMNADGTDEKRLIASDANDENPSISPNGKKVIFESSRDGVGKDQIYSVNLDGSGLTRLTNDDSNNVFPSWSPDATRVILGSSKGEGPHDVLILKMGETHGTNLGVDGFFPRWSPRGDRIAVIVGKYPMTSIWVMNADGTGRMQISK